MLVAGCKTRSGIERDYKGIAIIECGQRSQK